MPDMSATRTADAVPTYMGKGDPGGRFAGYYPAWVDKLASDVTLEGPMLDGEDLPGRSARVPVPAPRRLLRDVDTFLKERRVQRRAAREPTGVRTGAITR